MDCLHFNPSLTSNPPLHYCPFPNIVKCICVCEDSLQFTDTDTHFLKTQIQLARIWLIHHISPQLNTQLGFCYHRLPPVDKYISQFEEQKVKSTYNGDGETQVRGGADLQLHRLRSPSVPCADKDCITYIHTACWDLLRQ